MGLARFVWRSFASHRHRSRREGYYPFTYTSRRGPLLPMARVARRVIAIDIDRELLNVASVLQYQCGDMLERSRSFSSTLLDNGRTILLIAAVKRPG